MVLLTRAALLAVVACAGSKELVPIDSPNAETNDLASRFSNEGVELYREGKYGDAERKFKEAVARVPEPRFFFNLCLAFEKLGKLDEACLACTAGLKAGDHPALKPKLERMLTQLAATAKQRDVPLQCEPM